MKTGRPLEDKETVQEIAQLKGKKTNQGTRIDLLSTNDKKLELRIIRSSPHLNSIFALPTTVKEQSALLKWC
jgi:hypothetical protein